MINFLPNKKLRILYENHRGERNWRNVKFRELYWGKTEYHPEPGFLMSAYDLDKKEVREFSCKHIEEIQLPGTNT